MSQTRTDQTIRDIAIENPSAVCVFEAYGIDYCCGGRQSLENACERAQIPLEQVLESLENASSQLSPEDSKRWQDASMAELIDHITGKHHAYIRQELPRLQELSKKVVSRHGDTHAELRQIGDLFIAMAAELSTHMLKEEQVLFPYLQRMEAAVRNSAPVPPAFFGSVQNPIRHMLAEHDHAGELLKQIRSLSSNYQVPEGGCLSYGALYSGLEEFERDLHQHVHLENNILFPRALDMESRNVGR